MERRYAAKRDNSCFSEYNGGYSIFHSSGRIGMPLDVFISYAHKDRRLRDELAAHYMEFGEMLATSAFLARCVYTL